MSRIISKLLAVAVATALALPVGAANAQLGPFPWGQGNNGSGGGGGGTGNMNGSGAATTGNLLQSGNTGAVLNSATDSGVAVSSVVTTTGPQTVSGPKTFSNPILTGTVAGSPSASGTWSFGSVQISPNLITGLPSPTNASDAVTKSYVDALTGTSTTWHSSVTVATAAVLPNSPTYSNGSSGVGATLTAGSNVALVVDGVTVSTLTTRVLVQNQASAFQNGLYTLTQAGTGSVPWILTRATDFNTVGAGGVATGAAVLATSGTANTGLQFWMNQTAAITIGTTAITWVQIGGSGLVGGTGITISGGAINLNSTLPSALTIPSAALTSPTIGGFTIGLGGPITFPAAPGATACLHESAAGAVTAASADCVVSLGLGTGLTNAIGTQNTGSLSATAATPNIYPQNVPQAYTSNHTVALSDGVQTYVANGSGAITFTIGSVANDGAKGVGYCFIDKSGHGFTLTIAEPASGTFYGAGSGSSFTAGAGKSAYACATSDGTNVALGVAYPTAASVAGATGNPQYNSGGGFGADTGTFYLPAPTGTSADATQLANAITAAVTVGTGGVVQFQAGIYDLCLQQSVGDKVTLRGANRMNGWGFIGDETTGDPVIQTTIKCLDTPSFTSGQAQLAVTGNNVTIDGIGVDGTGISSGSNVDGIQINNVSKTHLLHVVVANSSRDGIRPSSTSGSTGVQLTQLDDVSVYGAHGIGFDPQISGGGFVSDGWINNSTFGGNSGRGIYCNFACAGYQFTNNKIQNNTGVGLVLRDAGANSVVGNAISNNIGGQIQLDGNQNSGGASGMINITGNAITGGNTTNSTTIPWSVDFVNTNLNVVLTGNTYNQTPGATGSTTAVLAIGAGAVCESCQINDAAAIAGSGIPAFASTNAEAALFGSFSSPQLLGQFTGTIGGAVTALPSAALNNSGTTALVSDGAAFTTGGGATYSPGGSTLRAVRSNGSNWLYADGGSPAGSTGNPQYNSGGGFGGDRGTFVVTAFSGVDPTGVSDSTTGIQAAINAATALTPCGVVYFPTGKYLISSTLTYGTQPGCVMRGVGGRSYDADNGSTIFTTTNITNMLTINSTCTGSNVQAGPTIDGITFDDQSGHNNTLLYLCNIMRFQIRNNSFRNGATGVSISSNTSNGQDNSDGSTYGNIFYENNIGYTQINNTATGGGQNTFYDNYVIMNGAGTIGVQCLIGGGGTGSFKIIGNRLDGAGGPAIDNTCGQVSIIGNTVEGGFYVGLRNQQTGGTAGEAISVVGNIWNISGANVGHTCTPVTSSTTWSCTATTGWQVGYELAGTNVAPFTHGTFAWGTSNLLGGGTYITAINPGVSITTNQVATGNPGAETINGCQTVYQIGTAAGQVAITGNNYLNAGNCQSVYYNQGQ